MFKDAVIESLTPENGFYAPQVVDVPELGTCVYVYDANQERLAIIVPLASDTWAGTRRLINCWLRFRQSQRQADYLLCFHVAPTIPERVLTALHNAPSVNAFQLKFVEAVAYA